MASTAPVSASESLWFVTRIDVGATKPAEAEASRKLVQLLRARGLDAIDGTSAGSEFERKHSRTSRALPPVDVADLDAALRKLADELASENLSQAQKLLADIQALSPDIRDQLNHDTQRARRRFHICLLAAHLYFKEGYASEAKEQVRRCARDFPGLEPETGPYLPDSIRQFFTRADEELAQIPASTVHVDIENGRNDGCRARLNGIDRGPTPATVEKVRTPRVRIQVDCGTRAGRIYDVSIAPGDNSFRIDLELDRAVQTQPTLDLRYSDPQTAADNRMLHTLRLARAVGATSVLSLWNGQIHRIDVAARRDTVLGELEDSSLETLVEGLEVPTDVARAPEAPAQATAASSDVGRTSPYQILGWVTAGAAVLAGSSVIIAWQVREGAVSKFNEEGRSDGGCTSRFALEQPNDCPGHLDAADDAEAAMKVLGFAGIALAGLATTFFVLDTQPRRAERAARGCGLGPGELGVACRLEF